MLKKEYDKLLSYTKYHLRGITGADAEDVLHEVVFNVFNKIDFESSVDNISAYLYQSIKNKIIDIIKKPKRTVSMNSFTDENGANILLETTKNSDENIHEELERKEKYEQLHRALWLLPPYYYDIIIATDFEGKTLKEISDEWGIPLGTLLSRRHRALTRLRKILENFNIQ